MLVLMTLSFFLPYLGGGIGGKTYASPSPPPSIREGWDWGCGWLDPPLPFVLANAQVGVGSKGQPLKTTILYF